MFLEKIPMRQLIAWIFTAMVPVGIQLLSDSSWIWVACGGIISMAVWMLLWRNGRERSKWESAFLFIYIVFLLGELLRYTAQCWPMGNSDPAVPLVLLTLAAWSARRGPSVAARVGAVLFWAVLGLYLLVFAAGINEVKLEWLMPDQNSINTAGLTVFLIPCSVLEISKEKKGTEKRMWLAPCMILAGVIITAGVLSPSAAAQIPNAFYEMSRSLSFLDVARRFEALICAAAAVGWFSLLSLLLTLCGRYTEKIFPTKGRGGIWIASLAAVTGRLCGLHINPLYLVAVGTVFWVGLPLLTQGLDKIKKS